MTTATHAPPVEATSRSFGLFRDLVAPRTWKSTAHLLGNLAVGVVTFTITLPALVGTAASVPLFPAAVLGAWLLVAVTRLLGRLERLRIWIFLDLDIPYPHPDDRALSWWRRLWARVGRASTWKEVGHPRPRAAGRRHHLLARPRHVVHPAHAPHPSPLRVGAPR